MRAGRYWVGFVLPFSMEVLIMKKERYKKRLKELCELQKESYEEMLILLKEDAFKEFADTCWVLSENQNDIVFYAQLLEEDD